MGCVVFIPGHLKLVGIPSSKNTWKSNSVVDRLDSLLMAVTNSNAGQSAHWSGHEIKPWQVENSTIPQNEPPIWLVSIWNIFAPVLLEVVAKRPKEQYSIQRTLKLSPCLSLTEPFDLLLQQIYKSFYRLTFLFSKKKKIHLWLFSETTCILYYLCYDIGLIKSLNPKLDKCFGETGQKVLWLMAFTPLSFSWKKEYHG